MLVLSRKKNERIVISGKLDGEVEICIVDIRGDKVRLGIQAATNVVIDRLEVYEAKKRDAQRA